MRYERKGYKSILGGMTPTAPLILSRDTNIHTIYNAGKFLGMRFVCRRRRDGLYVWRIE